MERRTLTAFAVALAAVGTVRAQVLVGWNSFEPNDGVSRVDDRTPDTAETGFEGLLGRYVNPLGTATNQGGGVSSSANHDHSGGSFTNRTYGSAFAIPDGDLGESSGIALNTFSGANRYVDVAVSNNSGVAVSIRTVHFDIAQTFGASGGTVRVSHFTTASDLEDAFTGRSLLDVKLDDGDLSGLQGRQHCDRSHTGRGDSNGSGRAFDRMGYAPQH